NLARWELTTTGWQDTSRKVRKGSRKQPVVSGLHALWLLDHCHSAILACRAAGEARRKKPFTFVFFAALRSNLPAADG
ncbi:MAG: hypothetical protein J7D61_17825, partial [Marichromatium sp.]|nr:hypothetical protein [Marichromatium sp.]